MSIGTAICDDMVTLLHGDCREAMATLDAESIDAIVTDPPYGLGFMGKAWDAKFMQHTTNLRRQYAGDPSGKTGQNGGYRSAASEAGRYDLSLSGNKGFQLWCQEWAEAAFRVLKPGGHLLAFGGTRTWHRLAVAIEDAGFEVRDSMAWLYGSGFPKSMDVSKAIDKAAGAERATKRVTYSTNVMQQGIGVERPWLKAAAENGFHEVADDTPITPEASKWQGWGTALKPAFEPIVVARKPLIGTVAENVLAHGTGALNIDGCRISGKPWQSVAPNSGGRSGGVMGKPVQHPGGDPHPDGRWPANVILDESQAAELDRRADELPARFFYVPKANSSERPRAGDTAHPTVKPLDLMRYLVKLVTPPGGTVLEPFAGSGTTLEACLIEGFKVIGIELTDDYLPLIKQRLSKPIEQVLL